MNLTYTSKHVFPQILLLNFKARLKSHLDKPGSWAAAKACIKKLNSLIFKLSASSCSATLNASNKFFAKTQGLVHMYILLIFNVYNTVFFKALIQSSQWCQITTIRFFNFYNTFFDFEMVQFFMHTVYIVVIYPLMTIPVFQESCNTYYSQF